MIRHYIIMSSAYTEGKRIALDITDEKLLNREEIEKITAKIKRECGDDVPLSTHFIEAESSCWDDISSYDPFFSGVEKVTNIDDFCRKINSGRTLSGLDVAKYIITKVKCTHLSLEKLTYFAYADYLCSTTKRLFDDDIYAFTYGPVVFSVYEKYKTMGAKCIDNHGDININKNGAIHTDLSEISSRSRILFAKDGAKKLQSIDDTIERYKYMSASELVERTHRQGTPWE